LVVLDEATSALDLYNEKSMYGILQEMADTSVGNGEAGLTYISVGHRPSLAEYHRVRLDLGGHSADGQTNRVVTILR
jgi:vitamin B12/bleomycin/antimicrobial peptide transport system ATP-binding/permease protein